RRSERGTARSRHARGGIGKFSRRIREGPPWVRGPTEPIPQRSSHSRGLGMDVRGASLTALLLALAAPGAVLAADAPPPGQGQDVSELVVTAQKLDEARATIEPGLGASTYTLSSQLVDTLPGGQNTLLNQVILQAPGVTQDSFGQLHARGDHANLQFRRDACILPDGRLVLGRA